MRVTQGTEGTHGAQAGARLVEYAHGCSGCSSGVTGGCGQQHGVACLGHVSDGCHVRFRNAHGGGITPPPLLQGPAHSDQRSRRRECHDVQRLCLPLCQLHCLLPLALSAQYGCVSLCSGHVDAGCALALAVQDKGTLATLGLRLRQKVGEGGGGRGAGEGRGCCTCLSIASRTLVGAWMSRIS